VWPLRAFFNDPETWILHYDNSGLHIGCLSLAFACFLSMWTTWGWASSNSRMIMSQNFFLDVCPWSWYTAFEVCDSHSLCWLCCYVIWSYEAGTYTVLWSCLDRFTTWYTIFNLCFNISPVSYFPICCPAQWLPMCLLSQIHSCAKAVPWTDFSCTCLW